MFTIISCFSDRLEYYALIFWIEGFFMDMVTDLEILFLSAGVMEGNLYSSVVILNNDVEKVDDGQRIGSGRRTAKVKVSTDNNNRLAHEMDKAFIFPAIVKCSVKTSVKAGEMVMTIINFQKSANSIGDNSLTENKIKVA
jgi:hypothetical protein